jgi:hypothetical protein
MIMQKKLLDISFEVNQSMITKQLTVWLLDERNWVDVYSVLKALGLGRKQLVFLRACAGMLGFDVVEDARIPDGLLIKAALLPKLLAQLGSDSSLTGRNKTLWRAAALAQAFPQAWRDAGFEMQPEKEAVIVPRKVNAHLVKELFGKLRAGKTAVACAKDLGISDRTIRRIRKGTHLLDFQTERAWLETFGGLRAEQAQQGRT